ncbi:hypothetical protein DB347_17800 [Opitutaceae bacterium EW11]|nr:hypothetical protein DB347_17800 [Opitutaceae bacterium EW11]
MPLSGEEKISAYSETGCELFSMRRAEGWCRRKNAGCGRAAHAEESTKVAGVEIVFVQEKFQNGDASCRFWNVLVFVLLNQPGHFVEIRFLVVVQFMPDECVQHLHGRNVCSRIVN